MLDFADEAAAGQSGENSLSRVSRDVTPEAEYLDIENDSWFLDNVLRNALLDYCSRVKVPTFFVAHQLPPAGRTNYSLAL